MIDKFDVVHISSVHPRYDTRISLKMCTSLAARDFKVALIVADGGGNEIMSDVHIIDIGSTPSNRLSRMIKTSYQIYKKAATLDADLYHIHDPELIPVGLKLILKGKKVVFDAHEDLPKQILSKPYLWSGSRYILSKFFEMFEKLACKYFSGIVAATPVIRDKFLAINENCIDINNYPIIGELAASQDWSERKGGVAYVGGLSEIRGAYRMLGAISRTDVPVKLKLAGDMSVKLRLKLTKEVGWENVVEYGFVGRKKVQNILDSVFAGLVVFQDAPNHTDAQPNKMFEYMSAGIPVIASDFHLWREIIVANNCGLCVNPDSEVEIAGAIDYLQSNLEIAEKMGKNGMDAIINHYNWAHEETKLVKFYNSLGIKND